MTKSFLPVAATLLALAACATTPPPKSASSKPEVMKVADDPYPSTYTPYPGVPTVVKNVTIYDGEGGRINGGAVRFENGRITALGAQVDEAGATVIDGRGKWVTPGVIDIHSHLGDYPSPAVAANSDGNEMSGPVHPDVWAEHSIWPQDPGFSRALANGGVTTLHILPGSGDLFGGRGTTLKNVASRTMQGMKFPGAPYSLKMACGENPKRVYGRRNQMPASRMGNVALDRQTWARAVEYRIRWQEYQKKVDAGTAKPTDAPVRDIGMDTLKGVLDGRILVENHCYRADEMADVIDMSKEFGYHVAAFHHAIEAYKIVDLLKANDICAGMWADWYGFKMEGNDGIRENIPFVHAGGGCAVIHSDDPNGIQRLNQEVAKALSDGRRVGLNISDEVAWTWLGINAAKAIGVADKVGSLKPGKMADVVLWNGDPFSVYTRPEKVWIDGALMLDASRGVRPVSDFELGQVGMGDVK